MPWSRPRSMSIAPRSLTPEKQSGSGRPSRQTAGFGIPGRGTWKSTLRSWLSIISSLRYSDSAPSAFSTGPTPTRASRSGLPNVRLSGIASSVRRRPPRPRCPGPRTPRAAASVYVPAGAEARSRRGSCCARGSRRPRTRCSSVGVDRRVVAAVGGQADAERRQELAVGDVLLLGADDRGARSGTSAPPRGRRAARRRSGCARARTACAWRSARCSRSRARRRRPSPSAGVAPRRALERHHGRGRGRCRGWSGAAAVRPGRAAASRRCRLRSPLTGPSRSHSSRWSVPP